MKGISQSSGVAGKYRQDADMNNMSCGNPDCPCGEKFAGTLDVSKEGGHKPYSHTIIRRIAPEAVGPQAEKDSGTKTGETNRESMAGKTVHKSGMQ